MLSRGMHHTARMPIIVSAAGPEALPATQAEVDERREARLAKKASMKISKKKTKKRASVTVGMTNAQAIHSGVERGLLKIVRTPHPAVEEAGWADAPEGLFVVLPGPNGHASYIFQIKDRLKRSLFEWNPSVKLWWRHDIRELFDANYEPRCRPASIWGFP